MTTHQSLIEAATAARALAYVPYSHFQVGAALLGKSGRIFQGCNVENVSFGLSSCAERNAVFGAIVQGERRFTTIAVVTDSATPTPPCGACRQVLLEFALDDMEVVMATLAGASRTTLLSALLPESFSSFQAGED